MNDSNLRTKNCLVAVACFLCILAKAEPLHAEDWEFVVAPYALFPDISGDASVGRVEGADVDVSCGQVRS